MKNNIKAAISLFLFCIFFFSGFAMAADWVHKSSDDGRRIIDFINASKVSIDGIQVVLSRNGEFHAWIRQNDNSADRYELKYIG